MIVTVMREHHWTPDVIDKLYFDDDDHHGIKFIYDDVKAVNDEIKGKAKKGGGSN